MNEKLSSLIGKEIKQEFDNTNWQGSLDEFILLVEKNPKVHVRTAFQYLNDMLHHFGCERINDCGDELLRYKLFDDPFNNGENAIYGNYRALEKLVDSIKSMAEQGGRERILILKGPVATAKTSMIRLLMQGMEEYSKLPEGSFFRFSWIFPKKSADINPGFKVSGHEFKEIDSYAHLKNEDVDKFPCQLNENPLMLFPKKQRLKLLNNIIKNSGRHIVIPEKIRKKELCFNCQNTYNALLHKYNGDIEKVFKHIKVERFIVSEIDRTSIATVQPVQNVEGHARIVAWESSKYSRINDYLPGIVLNMFEGKWADSNRGIIHMTDLFKRNPLYLQHLLSALEENLVNFNGADAFIDVVILGSSNLKEYRAFEQDKTNSGLKDRILSPDVGYILHYSEEAKIYEKQLGVAGYLKKRIKDSKHICPHALDYLALWAVTTRLFKPEYGNQCYAEDFKADEYLDDLTLVQKALLYNGELDEFFSFKEKQAFKDKGVQKAIRNEFPKEGLEGISPRQVQNLIAEMISKKESVETTKNLEKRCLSMFTIFRYIKKLYSSEGPLEDEDEAREVLNELQIKYDLRVNEEIKLSIAGVDETKVIEKIKEYVQHVNAYVQKQEIKNPITGEYEPPSESKMDWLEKSLEIPLTRDVDKEEFRTWVLKEIAEVADLDDEIPGLTNDDYKTLFKDNLYEALENIMFEDKVRQMKMGEDELKKAIRRYNTPKFAKLEQAHQKEVERIINNMIKQYNYCPDCAKDTLLYSFENKIIEVR